MQIPSASSASSTANSPAIRSRAATGSCPRSQSRDLRHPAVTPQDADEVNILLQSRRLYDWWPLKGACVVALHAGSIPSPAPQAQWLLAPRFSVGSAKPEIHPESRRFSVGKQAISARSGLDFQGIGVYPSDDFRARAGGLPPARRFIVRMRPPGYPSAWLLPSRARFRFTRRLILPLSGYSETAVGHRRVCRF